MSSEYQETPRSTVVQNEVRLIVSGNFTPDALGPDRYRAILAKVAAAPQEYLQAFRAQMREVAAGGRLSTSHLPSFLTILATIEPDAAKAAARELLDEYEKAGRDIGVPDPSAGPPTADSAQRMQRMERMERKAPETERDKQIDRLQDRAATLRRILER